MKSDRGAREDAKLAAGGYGKLATGIPKPHGVGKKVEGRVRRPREEERSCEVVRRRGVGARERDIAAGRKGWRSALQRVKRATFLDFRINRHGAECAPPDYNGVYFDSDPL